MASKSEFVGNIVRDMVETSAVSARWLTSDEATNAAFVGEWDNLANTASEPNAFYESWYLLPSLREFGANARVFAVWSGHVLTGLMPMESQSHYGRWPVPHIQNWMHPNMFLGTPLIRKGHESEFWRMVAAELDSRPGKALFLHINGMAVAGPAAAALTNLAEKERRKFALVKQETRAFLQSDLSPEAYYENAMRSKKRKELRRQKNRLAEMGELAFSRSDGSTDLSKWCAAFLELERQGWKGSQGSALDCADETRRLFQDVLAGGAKRGRLELLDLKLDGKPMAMLVNFLTAPGSFSFKTAFDEDFARFSPGVLLQIENLALLERSGIDWCDSCAAEGHPMIDSVWTDRRTVGRYSMAIGGAGRRALFGAYLGAELARERRRAHPASPLQIELQE